MDERPTEQDLTEKTNKNTSVVSNGITTSTINRTKQRTFWEKISGLSTKKRNPSKSTPRKAYQEKQDRIRTDFVAEVHPVVAVGKDMCLTSIQEAFQLINVSARCEEPKSPDQYDDWVIVHYEETESTLLLKPARYIQRCLLPTFHRRDVRPIIDHKTPDLLPARIDRQYLLDLKRTRVSEKNPNMTKQWRINGQSLPRDPVQNLVEIKKQTQKQSFQVGLFFRRVFFLSWLNIHLFLWEFGNVFWICSASTILAHGP